MGHVPSTVVSSFVFRDQGYLTISLGIVLTARSNVFLGGCQVINSGEILGTKLFEEQ